MTRSRRPGLLSAGHPSHTPCMLQQAVWPWPLEGFSSLYAVPGLAASYPSRHPREASRPLLRRHCCVASRLCDADHLARVAQLPPGQPYWLARSVTPSRGCQELCSSWRARESASPAGAPAAVRVSAREGRPDGLVERAAALGSTLVATHHRPRQPLLRSLSALCSARGQRSSALAPGVHEHSLSALFRARLRCSSELGSSASSELADVHSLMCTA